MAGKRLLDLATLFNASRSIAQKTLTMGARQWHLYNETSSLAKAVKSQTDRVTETARAASFLAGRLNEDGPRWATQQVNSTGQDPDPIPSARTQTSSGQVRPKSGIDADHHYEPSKTNTATGPPPSNDLDVLQKEADRHALPDGTIPPSESNLNVPKIDSDTVSERLDTTEKHILEGDKHSLEVAQEKAERYPLPDGTIPPTNSSLNKAETDHSVFSHRPSATEKNVLNSREASLKPVSSEASTIPTPSSNPTSSSSLHNRQVQREHEEQIPSHPADTEAHPTSRLNVGHDVDSYYEMPSHSSPVLSSLPRSKIPKHTENIQDNRPQINDLGVNSDSFSAPSATLEPEDVPEGVDTNLFYSPKVSKMLAGGDSPYMKAPQKPRPAELRPHPAMERNTSNPASFPKRGTANAESRAAVPLSGSIENVPDDVSEVAKSASQEDLGDVASSLKTAIESPTGGSKPFQMRESSVPSSRLGRLWNYGGLAAGMFGGAVSESLRRVTGNGGEGSYMLSSANMDRLVAKLSRMRGAALKLGQLMSFQDSKMLPAQIQQVLLRVQDSADYMPTYQRDQVLMANLGPDWRDLFSSFDEKPLAAASIGQVHAATLASTGERVAVKVQYPGVADSIDSDLSNLAVLLTASRLLPKGLYLDKTIANARTELAWECDYLREAQCGQRFQELLADETDIFVVPKVFPEASGKSVLTMAFMDGIGVTKVQTFTQEQKDWIGTQILRLCLREITEFRFMQTDPNWTNFLFNTKTNKLELLDFGASRDYPEDFITRYTKLLLAASRSDTETVRVLSIELGYLTGHESKAMLKAHIASVMTLAEPFLATSPEVYDFQDQTITERVKALIPLMINERLAPPPEETYSLHRKLSGAFLLCARLGSKVPCRRLFEDSMRKAGFTS